MPNNRKNPILALLGAFALLLAAFRAGPPGHGPEAVQKARAADARRFEQELAEANGDMRRWAEKRGPTWNTDEYRQYQRERESLRTRGRNAAP